MNPGLQCLKESTQMDSTLLCESSAWWLLGLSVRLDELKLGWHSVEARGLQTACVVTT